MVMFSQLRRCDLTDEQGQQASLLDLSVALLDADYPPVTSLAALGADCVSGFAGAAFSYEVSPSSSGNPPLAGHSRPGVDCHFSRQ